MVMKDFITAIIGGGASGLILASSLKKGDSVVLFERGERLGKKLSSTGNGQGNLTNVGVLTERYFTSSCTGEQRVTDILRAFDDQAMKKDLQDKGLLLTTDERGRVYPAGRQASSVTDALRFCVAEKGVDVRLQTKIVDLVWEKGWFLLTAETPQGEEIFRAKKVVLCAGGKAAKNFGTDGTAYALAEKFGHTVTELHPSLVQLKTDITYIKTLKGIRVNDGKLCVWTEGENEELTVQGDIIFTDYGVSGDAVFRASAFIADKINTGNVRLSIDFLPDFDGETIYRALMKKHANFPDLPVAELLGGMVNNQIGRAIFKRANGELLAAASLVKSFPLCVTGSLGFDYAQVTKGGISMDEVDEELQSHFVKGLYFAGEILDVDGQCGGYNLQWAYSSAKTVAKAIDSENSSCDFSIKNRK